MNQKHFVLIIFISLLGAACQTPNPSANGNQASNSAVSNSAIKTPVSAAEKPENVEYGARQTVSFDAPDGVKIVGTFYAATKENSPAVLLLHQYGGSRSNYKNLAGQFQSNGIAVLAIDGRGFGESTRKTDGSRVAASQSDEAVTGMKSDVAAAVKFLGEQRAVDKNKIGIVGASYSSSLAIIYAAENSAIKAVALLSPGTNYFGNLPTEPAIAKYGTRPLLIVAAEDDQDSANDSRRLDKLAAGDKHELRIYKRGGHGTGIFAAGVNLENTLLEFFRQNL